MSKSLCKVCISDGKDCWIPVTLSSYENIIFRKIPSSNSDCYEYCLRKNICYNLQFLEYIVKTLDECDLTTVLLIQNYKMFVILSTSILEGVLYHEIKKNGLQSKTLWNQITEFITERNSQDKKMRIESKLYEQSEIEKELDMTLDQMINKAESKHLLGKEHEIYGNLNILRKLRNKVHLQLAQSRVDTDYNSFDDQKLKLAKKTLLSIMKDYFELNEVEVNNYFYWAIVKEEIDTKDVLSHIEEF